MKKKKTSPRKKTSRRDFVKKVGAAAAAGAVMASMPKTASAAMTGPALNAKKLQELKNNQQTLKQFKQSVDAVVQNMVRDREFASMIMENADSVQLVNLYNSNRNTLDGLVGKIDGRTRVGKYCKVVVAAELFDNVSGLDEVKFVAGSEEVSYGGNGAVPLGSSSTCSGCDPDDTAILGCCIVHFWGWTCTGSCTSCSP